jgi:hypothetical protein
MKAQAFLKLVGEMLTAQQDYYRARKLRNGSEYSLLVKAKELEKKALAVVKEGRLEPDEPEPIVHVHTTEEFQRQFSLDFPGMERPTVDKGEHNEE